MTSPVQIDRRAFNAAGKTAREAMASVRAAAEAVHPTASVSLEVFGEPTAEGIYTVVADYWLMPESNPLDDEPVPAP